MQIKGLPAFIICRDVRVNYRIGEHPYCRACLVIDSERTDDFLNAAERRISVRVTDDNDSCIFEGFAGSCVVSEYLSETTAELMIFSPSKLCSEKGEERIYQCPSKTVADILKDFPEADLGEGFDRNAKLEEIICQHNCDDFTFLCRIARRCGCILAVTEDGRITLGNISNPGAKLMLNTDDREKRVFGAQYFSEKGKKGIHFKALKKFPLGSVVTINGNEYLVSEINIADEYHEVVYSYTVYSQQDSEKCTAFAGSITAEAEITDNNDPDKKGRVQVSFTEYSDEAEEHAWIPYLTPFVGEHNGGFVMLPDVGDHVVVHIADGVPYVIGSLRVNSIPENCSDVHCKYIAVDKSLCELDDRHILFSQGDKTAYRLEDSSASLVVDKTKLESFGDSLSIDTGTLSIKADKASADCGKSGLSMEGGGAEISNGGSALSLRNGTTVLKGKSIKLNSQGMV